MLWRNFFHNFSKSFKITLAEKIDSTFISLLESLYIAQYQDSNSKLQTINKAISTLDILKFFLQIAWESKELDERKFILLSEKLVEVSKMLSGWKKYLEQKTPTKI